MTIELDAAQASLHFDRVLQLLDGLGALATELGEPGIRLLALFQDPSPEVVKARVISALRAAGIEEVTIEARTTTTFDWGSGWPEILRPFQVGPLWISPPSGEPPSSGATRLWIEPGQAFGSGHHPTTRLCLARIVELSPIERLLDVGTGSGILALAALKLGASFAMGTDDDQEALALAHDNAERNGLLPRLQLLTREPDRLEAQFPVIVANVLPASLIALAPRLVRALASHGQLSVSGLRQDDHADVARAYCDRGLHLVGSAREGEWLRLDLSASW